MRPPLKLECTLGVIRSANRCNRTAANAATVKPGVYTRSYNGGLCSLFDRPPTPESSLFDRTPTPGFSTERQDHTPIAPTMSGGVHPNLRRWATSEDAEQQVSLQDIGTDEMSQVMAALEFSDIVALSLTCNSFRKATASRLQTEFDTIHKFDLPSPREYGRMLLVAMQKPQVLRVGDIYSAVHSSMDCWTEKPSFTFYRINALRGKKTCLVEQVGNHGNGVFQGDHYPPITIRKWKHDQRRLMLPMKRGLLKLHYTCVQGLCFNTYISDDML